MLLLAGCNRILGLGAVEQRDAMYFDANIDAPFTCPAGLPSFDHSHFVQVLVQSCGFYSESEDRMHAFASCDTVISEGATDGSQLAPAPGFEPVGNSTYTSVLLGPDGATATAVRRTVTPTGGMTEVVVLDRGAATWQPRVTLPTSGIALTVSELSRGPNAHVLVGLATGEMQELVDTGAGWDQRTPFTFLDYQRQNFIQLTPDGLHAWWNHGATYYASRPTLDDPFTEVGPIPGGDGLGVAFISSDCGWIYFPTLDRIWKAPRAD